MSSPYVGQLKMFGGSFAPAGWAFCAGQLIPISENEVLFNLIGTTYGGDGQSTFALPDLRGRIPVHTGQGSGLSPYVIGQLAGSETVTVTTSQIPSHTHNAMGQSGSGNQSSPNGGVWAASSLNEYSSTAANVNMNAGAIGAAGGSQPHDNMMPFLCVSFIISLFGIFPSQN